MTCQAGCLTAAHPFIFAMAPESPCSGEAECMDLCAFLRVVPMVSVLLRCVADFSPSAGSLEVMLWLHVTPAHVGPAPNEFPHIHLWKAKCSMMVILKTARMCSASLLGVAFMGHCASPVCGYRASETCSAKACAGESFP